MRLWNRTSPPPAQRTEFIPVEGAADLDSLIRESYRKPVVLLVHDPVCGISRRAYQEVEQLGGTVFLIQTGDGRHLSEEVQARTGVRHESPQAFVFTRGAVIWSAAHFAVRQEALGRALQAAKHEVARARDAETSG